jgi:hypothetical protein
LRFCPARELNLVFARLAPKVVCRGRDKGMPNSCSFSWENMATRERESLEMHCVESLLVVYVCVIRRVSPAHKGLMTKLPHHNVL